MKKDHFLKALDHSRVTSAIAEAEQRSSGQIRVFVTHRAVEDVSEAARGRFAKLGMEKTAARNAVLVYFAPEAQRYAVVGDQGIHEKCGGDEFWKSLVDQTMRPLLKEGRYTDAIVAAVAIIGGELSKHFPRGTGTQTNELPDVVEEEN